jgi:hypothetical protein
LSLAAGKGQAAVSSTFQEAKENLMDIKFRLVVQVVDILSYNPVEEVLVAVAWRSTMPVVELTFTPLIIKKLLIVPDPKVIGGSP